MQPWLNISDYTVSMKVGSSWNVGLLFLTASLAFSVEQTLCRSLPWAQARKTCSWSIIVFCPPETLYLNDVSLHFPPESHSSELSLYAVRGIITSCVFLPSFNDSCGAINAATPARALALSSTAEPENKPLIKIQTCESLSLQGRPSHCLLQGLGAVDFEVGLCTLWCILQLKQTWWSVFMFFLHK